MAEQGKHRKLIAEYGTNKQGIQYSRCIYENNEYTYVLERLQQNGVRIQTAFTASKMMGYGFTEADEIFCRITTNYVGVEEVVHEWEEMTGMNLTQFHRYMERKDKYCKCGDTRIEYAGAGYPGEHMYVCRKCGAVRRVDFNVSEVI